MTKTYNLYTPSLTLEIFSYVKFLSAYIPISPKLSAYLLQTFITLAYPGNLGE